MPQEKLAARWFTSGLTAVDTTQTPEASQVYRDRVGRSEKRSFSSYLLLGVRAIGERSSSNHASWVFFHCENPHGSAYAC
jgi:hypothetical protein